MADKGNDPAELWRTMLGEMEKGFNSFANQAMATPEFSKAMNQAGTASANAQRQVGDMMEKYLTSMNLPSRAQMISFGERLQAIESDLADIKSLLRAVYQHFNAGDASAASTGLAPRPPRTKKPATKSGGDA